jgi:hypothetical protein
MRLSLDPMYTVPSEPSAGVAITDAPVRYCHTRSPVSVCTQETNQSLLPTYTHGSSEDITGDDTTVPPKALVNRCVKAKPLGAVTEVNPECCRSRPS